MTDEKFIHNFLNKHYSVTIGNIDFMIIDLKNDNHMPYSSGYGDSITKIFKDVIGEFITDTGIPSFDVLSRWYSDKCDIITQKLDGYFNEYDGRHNFEIILEEIVSKFGEEFNRAFLLYRVKIHYKEKHLKRKVDEYLEIADFTGGSKSAIYDLNQYFNGDISYFKEDIEAQFNKKYSGFIINEIDKYLTTINKDEVKSDEFINNFHYSLDNETELHRHDNAKILKDWYNVNVLNDRLIPFFNELIVTMGATDWLVTWIGHGRLTEEKLLNNFRDEKDYSANYIKQRYEDWYSEKIIEVSERYIKNAW